MGSCRSFRFVTGLLETLEHEHRHEAADVQAVGCRVEAAIQCDSPLREHFIECRRIGGLGDQATGVQILQKGGLVHLGFSKRLARASRKNAKVGF